MVDKTRKKNIKTQDMKKTSKKKKFKAVLDKDAPNEIKRNKKFNIDREEIPWGEKKPHTKKERELLLKTCGKDAFLLPTHLKFPICNKITEKNKKCTYNCRGLKAASSRAGEWGYTKILKLSKSLTLELGCYKNKKIKK